MPKVQSLFFIMPISKAQIKNIKSLHQSKFRKEKGLFIIEGEKLIAEAMNAGVIFDSIFVTNTALPREWKMELIAEHEMEQLTCLSNPSPCLAVVHQLNFNPIPQNSKVLYLDGIKDPGNLGTIIRSADAFGWNNIVLAPQCVELYNPKVVQSTMGSLFHVNVHLDKDGSFIRNARSNQRSIVGADLKGEKLLNSTIPGANAVLVIGSESHGLSDAVRENINHYVNIEQAGNAESLNAAIAASIIMHQWGA